MAANGPGMRTLTGEFITLHPVASPVAVYLQAAAPRGILNALSQVPHLSAVETICGAKPQIPVAVGEDPNDLCRNFGGMHRDYLFSLHEGESMPMHGYP